MPFEMPLEDVRELREWSSEVRKSKYPHLQGVRFEFTVRRKKPELSYYGFEVKLSKGSFYENIVYDSKSYNKSQILRQLDEFFSKVNNMLSKKSTEDLSKLLRSLL